MASFTKQIAIENRYRRTICMTFLCAGAALLQTGCASNSDKLVNSENECVINCGYIANVIDNLLNSDDERTTIPVCSYTTEGIYTCQDPQFWQRQKANPDFEFQQQQLPIYQRVDIIEDELEAMRNRK
ncbi:hypothetical protein PN836_006040 [Ningiella sp. W23]|uniref:hypothetical protein n=1 Tax=Ningiella sp. W23 TaxID=3023715 RepID=UPI00375707C5